MLATRKPLVDAGVRESRELVRELEGDPKAALQLIAAYHTLARIEVEAGNQQKAIESARAGVAAAQELKNRDDSLRNDKLAGQRTATLKRRPARQRRKPARGSAIERPSSK